jgi:lysozyme
MIKGLDVSKSQKNVDWKKVAAAGYRWCGVKATEGRTFLSPTCESHLKGAREEGLQTFIYHFALPGPEPRDAARECDWMLEIHARFRPYISLLPCLDIEKHKLPDNKTSLWVRAFLDRAALIFPKPIPVYTYLSFLKRLDKGMGFEAHPLWLAAPTYPPSRLTGPWKTWDAWQFTSSGRLAGIEGDVDLNLVKDLGPFLL